MAGYKHYGCGNENQILHIKNMSTEYYHMVKMFYKGVPIYQSGNVNSNQGVKHIPIKIGIKK